MFRCHFTKKLSMPGEQPQKLVTHVRPKTYYRTNHKTGLREVTGKGTEIVHEVLVSREHYAKLMSEGFAPQVVANKEERPQQQISYENE